MMLLHAMLRVGDRSRSVDVCTRIIGMEHLRTVERTTASYTLAFVAFDCGNFRWRGKMAARSVNRLWHLDRPVALRPA